MKNKYWVYLFSFLCILLTSILFSFRLNDTALMEADAPKIIGYSQSGTESNWKQANANSIITELKKQNYNVLTSSAFLNKEKQIADIRKFIAYKVDAIILSPLSDSGFDEVITEAKEAKIPIILVNESLNSPLANQEVLTHIGPNYKSEGNRAGLYMLNRFAEAPSAVNVIEITGNPSSLMAEQRSTGFNEIIKRNPNIHLIDTLDGEYLRLKTEEVVREAISLGKFDTVDAIYIHSDEMLLGTLHALKKYKPDLLKTVKIISIEGSTETVDLLKSGTINCVVESNPLYGWNVANTLKRYFNHFNPPKEIYISGTVFSDQGDLTTIPPRNY